MSTQLRGDTCHDLYVHLFSKLYILFAFFLFIALFYLFPSLPLTFPCHSLSSVKAFTLYQGGDYHSEIIDLLSVCRTVSNDCTSWALSKGHT